MLIERILDGYRKFTGDIETASPLVTVPARRPAANAGDFERSAMQARRLRRQRRLARSAGTRLGGWAVKTW
ncbi:MAG: hypothetical protein P8Y54_11160 [Xanthomonadales bacterium]